MDNAYYLTHPRIDKTAVVYAPTTEKARTTFLDWLERNNLISRSHRNYFRRDMIAERLEDPSVPADVELHYGYDGIPQTSEVYRMGPEPGEIQPWSPDCMGEGDELVDEFMKEKEMEEEEPKLGRMPIQDVMLRGYE